MQGSFYFEKRCRRPPFNSRMFSSPRTPRKEIFFKHTRILLPVFVLVRTLCDVAPLHPLCQKHLCSNQRIASCETLLYLCQCYLCRYTSGSLLPVILRKNLRWENVVFGREFVVLYINWKVQKNIHSLYNSMHAACSHGGYCTHVYSIIYTISVINFTIYFQHETFRFV